MADIKKKAHARGATAEATADEVGAQQSGILTKLLSAPPVYVRWMLLAAGIAILIMGAGAMLLNQQHTRAQIELSLDFGGSLARFIAVENADAVLLEDWVGLQTIVESINRDQVIGYLNITDHQGIIRGSTNPNQVGQNYASPENATLLSERGPTLIYQTNLPDRVLLHFEVPLLFQRAEIGRVQLGLVKSSHNQAIPTTLFLLGLVVLISMVTLAYAASTRLDKPLKVLDRALQEMAWGRYECRITERGPNDVRSIYNTYNQIAEFLQQSEITLTSGPEVKLMPSVADIAPIVEDDATKTVDIAELRRRSTKIPNNPFADGSK
ncbi:MAG: hypothetical protein V2J55_17930 [Candidatus Competibacteraceae bacterium]|jgi:serine/threonine-protein kinase|nr:hypothetical protein [Candidatus Competibacteraceae bacterium]